MEAVEYISSKDFSRNGSDSQIIADMWQSNVKLAFEKGRNTAFVSTTLDGIP